MSSIQISKPSNGRPESYASRSQVDDIVEELKTPTLTEVAELVKALFYADDVTM